jgi:hypothetical protein
MVDEIARRWKLFDSTFCANSEGACPLHVLVKTLQDTLSQCEQFPVVLYDVQGNTASGLKFLKQPFKLKLQRGMLIVLVGWIGLD